MIWDKLLLKLFQNILHQNSRWKAFTYVPRSPHLLPWSAPQPQWGCPFPPALEVIPLTPCGALFFFFEGDDDGKYIHVSLISLMSNFLTLSPHFYENFQFFFLFWCFVKTTFSWLVVWWNYFLKEDWLFREKTILPIWCSPVPKILSHHLAAFGARFLGHFLLLLLIQTELPVWCSGLIFLF